jgi:hypothetical protein
VPAIDGARRRVSSPARCGLRPGLRLGARASSSRRRGCATCATIGFPDRARHRDRQRGRRPQPEG